MKRKPDSHSRSAHPVIFALLIFRIRRLAKYDWCKKPGRK
jgi:hypothetical protein